MSRLRFRDESPRVSSELCSKHTGAAAEDETGGLKATGAGLSAGARVGTASPTPLTYEHMLSKRDCRVAESTRAATAAGGTGFTEAALASAAPPIVGASESSTFLACVS